VEEVKEHLPEELQSILLIKKKREYDMYLGSSTGSLLIPNLALSNIEKMHGIYTNVNQHSIFSLSTFKIRYKKGEEFIQIHHLNVLLQLIKGKRTFGESRRLKGLIKKSFSIAEFNELKNSDKDVIVTVTNLTLNKVEYKSIKILVTKNSVNGFGFRAIMCLL